MAANVVHATPELRVTLGHLRSLLAPGGQLVLLEATTRERFADLTVGFTPGWWAFEDTDAASRLRAAVARAVAEQLADAGFAATAAVPSAEGSALRREAVVLASVPDQVSMAPTRGAQRWAVVGDGPLTDAVAAALGAAGDAVVRLPVGDRAAVAPPSPPTTRPAWSWWWTPGPSRPSPTRRVTGPPRGAHGPGSGCRPGRCSTRRRPAPSGS